MVAATPRNLILPRNVIAEIVGHDPRAVRQFEALFQSQNGQSPNYGSRVVDADGGILAGDFLVKVDATAAAVNVDLPPASQAEGRELVFKLIDASGNGMTITPDGAETIDGGGALNTLVQWEYWRLQSDGVEWFIIGQG